jgi:hypothetical protein
MWKRIILAAKLGVNYGKEEAGKKERGLPVLEEFRTKLQQRRTRETRSGT